MTKPKKSKINAESLTVQQVAIDALKPYENNPRDNKPAVAKVAASIKEFGFRQLNLALESITGKWYKMTKPRATEIAAGLLIINERNLAMTDTSIPQKTESKQELWKPIPGEDGYEASTLGRIRSLDRECEFMTRWGITAKRPHKGKILTPKNNGNDYFFVQVNGSEAYVHRLVALAFYGQPPTSKHQAAHQNGDKKNSAPENIRWKTKAENEADKAIHGTSGKGAKNSQARLDDSKAEEIIRLYAEGKTSKELAIKFKVSPAAILNTDLGRAWSHIDSPYRGLARQQAKKNIALSWETNNMRFAT